MSELPDLEVYGDGAPRPSRSPHVVLGWSLLAAVLVFLVPAAAEACSCGPRWMIVQNALSDPEAIVFVGAAESYVPTGAPQGGFFGPPRLVRWK